MRSELGGDEGQRVAASARLDGWLSAQAGVPAARVRLVPGGRGGFDPVTWSVSLPVEESDPDVLASAVLHENVHKAQFFLMWRQKVPDVSGPGELASRVGTLNLAAAELAWEAGGLVQGSRPWAGRGGVVGRAGGRRGRRGAAGG